MYINDKGIDNSGFHQENTIYKRTSREYTDEKFVADSNNGVAKYVFNRTLNKDYYFTRTPEKEGFYKFSGTLSLENSYKKTALLVFGKIVKVTPEPDGTYIFRFNPALIDSGNDEISDKEKIVLTM